MKTEKEKIALYWIVGIILIISIICATLIWINYNSWTLRFEMDNNTLEAIKSVNWSVLSSANCTGPAC